MKATALVVALLMTVAVPTVALAGDDRPYGSYDPATGRYNYGNQDSSYIYQNSGGGAHDDQGTTYSPAGKDIIKNDDGSYLIKTGNGYIDTSTGRFIPSN